MRIDIFIAAMVLLGEPKKWDQALQLMVDLLVTDGKPNAPPSTMPEVHLPILAANMDLQFMDLACMPRYINYSGCVHTIFLESFLAAIKCEIIDTRKGCVT